MSAADSARIYADLQQDIPCHPGPDWTRFVCISDTHSELFDVPPGDVLLHAGDLSSWGSFPQLKVTLDWLGSLEHPVKIIIAGNHDLSLDEAWGGASDFGLRVEDVLNARSYIRSQVMKDAGIHYLEHESFCFTTSVGREWKVYGSPAAPTYVQGSFQYSNSEEGNAIYSRIPSDIDILITHTPPYMTLDRTRKGKHAGCDILSAKLEELRKCRLHVFGHIHEAYGASAKCDDSSREIKRVSVNAAVARSETAIVVDLRN